MTTTDRRGVIVSATDPTPGSVPNPALAWLAPVLVATVGVNITLSGLLTIDGVAMLGGERVLVKDQTDQTTNGIYNTSSGPWTRALDANSNVQFAQGMQVEVASGTFNARSSWVLTTAGPIVLGTSLLTYVSNASNKTVLTSALALYVSPTGSDSNTGLSPALPVLTPNRADAILRQFFDINGKNVTINLANGTYPPLLVQGPYPGDQGGNVTFVGSPNLAVSGATNATPIVLTVQGHTYTTGMHVVTHGILGNTAANGAFKIGATTGSTITLLKEIDGSNTTGNGAYTSGGIVSAPRNVVLSSTSQNVGVGDVLGPAIEALGGAFFNIAGIGVVASVGQGIVAIDRSRINSMGPIDFGQCGNAQVYSTRRSYIEIDYNFSISGGSIAAGWGQATHGGELRKIAQGYFTASVAYATGTNFAFTDYGEIVETGTLPTSAAETVTGATNATPIVLTVPNHGYGNNDVVTVTGVQGNTAANGTWLVSGATANTITLLTGGGANSVGNGVYIPGSGSVVRNVLGISGATNASPIVITAASHGFNTGDVAIVANVAGNTAANGAWTITVVDVNRFSLNGSTGNGAYTSGGGINGPGISWNLQGFSVTSAASLRQWLSSQQGQIQVHGNFPPPQNYYPGATGGIHQFGSGTTGPNFFLGQGAGFFVTVDQTAGLVVQDWLGAKNLFRLSNGGIAIFGDDGITAGTVQFSAASSGHTQVQAQNNANGLFFLPSIVGTDTMIARTTTDTLSNKLIDTAGPNTLRVNGVTLSPGQYPGTTTSDSATTGNFGELLSSTLLRTSAIALTSNITVNVTSLPLTAGNWEVEGQIYLIGNAATLLLGSQASISLTGSALTATPGQWINVDGQGAAPFARVTDQSPPLIGPVRLSFSATTTAFLTANINFSTNTCGVYGILRAVRPR